MTESKNEQGEAYLKLNDGVDNALDEADTIVSVEDRRYTHEEVFSNLRRRVNSGYK